MTPHPNSAEAVCPGEAPLRLHPQLSRQSPPNEAPTLPGQPWIYWSETMKIKRPKKRFIILGIMLAAGALAIATGYIWFGFLLIAVFMVLA